MIKHVRLRAQYVIMFLTSYQINSVFPQVTFESIFITDDIGVWDKCKERLMSNTRSIENTILPKYSQQKYAKETVSLDI